MSTIEKLKSKFYSSPTPKDITTDEIKRLAEYYGCGVKTGGNHQIAIVNKKTGTVVPLPQHDKAVKPAYIKELRNCFREEEK